MNKEQTGAREIMMSRTHMQASKDKLKGGMNKTQDTTRQMDRMISNTIYYVHTINLKEIKL